LLVSAITIAGAVLFVFFTDKEIIFLKDGTVKTVDETWPSGNSVFYEIDGQIFSLSKDEIQKYGKRDIFNLFQAIQKSADKNWRHMEKGINASLDKINLSIRPDLKLFLILGLLLFLLLMILRLRRPGADTSKKLRALEPGVPQPKMTDEPPNQLDIVRFFLNLYKYQIGAEEDAPVEFAPLMSKTPGPNNIYELRVKHREDWSKRRMTIGPLGEESGSKSKCYYVIYDVHMVIKVPVKPIGDFERYIESIKNEVNIVNKLIPRECIIPKVSVILGLIHSFPYSEDSPPEILEERYINWLRNSTEYQEFLKINNAFVFFMDLSKYYFLGRIIDELHNIKYMIAKEITENAHIIWEPAKFKGRYGTEKDAIFEIREIYNRCETEIRHLLARHGIRTPISFYQIQTWFFTHLASQQIKPDTDSYPENFILGVNSLLKKNVEENSRIVEEYRKEIKDFVYRSSFEQNKAQMGAITVNLLDMLAWFRARQVAMRDLKPDNLFVAGDPAKYPLFLKSASEFSLGIIDVETAVDFERYKYKKTKQPLLGGTPFYATPSHFIRNRVLVDIYGNLAKILHIQDWHATLVMIYKVITGELLFEQTARLFVDMRSMMQRVNKPGACDTDAYEEISRMFWHSAVAEFQMKTGESHNTLTNVAITLPKMVGSMFGKVLTREKMSIVRAIRECVQSQKVFQKPQTRELLLRASYAETCRFKTKLESRTNDSGNPVGPRTEAIAFLHKLADLKAIFGQNVYMQKLLEHPASGTSTYDILVFMFNVVLNNMYRSEWKPLSGEAVHGCEMPDEETILETSV
jgi:serine/threonine protein kinase